MDRVPRLVRSSSVAEGTSTGIASKRWKRTLQQKQILESLFASGTTNPSTERVAEITAELQRYGQVEGKNVFYWFPNAKARKKRAEKQSQTSYSKWPTFFRNSVFRSKKPADINTAEEEEEANVGFRRNSSVDVPEFRTLDLFPKHPARGDF